MLDIVLGTYDKAMLPSRLWKGPVLPENEAEWGQLLVLRPNIAEPPPRAYYRRGEDSIVLCGNMVGRNPFSFTPRIPTQTTSGPISSCPPTILLLTTTDKRRLRFVNDDVADYHT